MTQDKKKKKVMSYPTLFLTRRLNVKDILDDTIFKSYVQTLLLIY